MAGPLSYRIVSQSPADPQQNSEVRFTLTPVQGADSNRIRELRFDTYSVVAEGKSSVRAFGLEGVSAVVHLNQAGQVDSVTEPKEARRGHGGLLRRWADDLFPTRPRAVNRGAAWSAPIQRAFLGFNAPLNMGAPDRVIQSGTANYNVLGDSTIRGIRAVLVSIEEKLTEHVSSVDGDPLEAASGKRRTSEVSLSSKGIYAFSPNGALLGFRREVSRVLVPERGSESPVSHTTQQTLELVHP
jgi:hypothetical protein